MKKPKKLQTTVKGLSAIITAGAWAKAEKPIHNSTTTERYAAHELRPFAGRPGSLDFLSWPSVRGNRLVYRGDAL